VLVPSSPTLTCAQPQRFRGSVQQLCTDREAERFSEPVHIRRGLQVLLHLESVLVLVPSSRHDAHLVEWAVEELGDMGPSATSI
jgi:hypothetical protein